MSEFGELQLKISIIKSASANFDKTYNGSKMKLIPFQRKFADFENT